MRDVKLVGEVPDHVLKVVARIIDRYNRYRVPEAEAKPVAVESVGKGLYLLKVLFTGSFCGTCGVRDWVEDLAYVAESMGFKVDLEEVLEPAGGEAGFRVGVFLLKLDARQS